MLRIVMTTALTAGLLAGCNAGTDQPARTAADGDDSIPQTGSAYTQSGDSMGVQGTATGTAYQAPAYIRAVEPQLEQMRANAAEWAAQNRTAHKILTADLITAMRNDYNRAGITESAEMRALADSIASNLGGGTGEADALSADDVPSHAAALERLIAGYEQAMADAPATPPADGDSVMPAE